MEAYQKKLSDFKQKNKDYIEPEAREIRRLFSKENKEKEVRKQEIEEELDGDDDEEVGVEIDEEENKTKSEDEDEDDDEDEDEDEDQEVDEDDEVGNEVNEEVVAEGIYLKLNNENMVILKKTF